MLTSALAGEPRVIRRSCSVLALAFAAGLATALPAHSESMVQALIAAYTNNPRIMSERAHLRSVDENLARAQSGYRPTVAGAIDYTYTNTDSKPSSLGNGDNFSRSYTLTANQPLFSGGSVVAAVNAADANIRAEREVLRDTEQQVLLAAVTAYMDVIRDRATLDVQQKNVNVLQQELKQVKARFDVGEVTKTDVEQARASLALAQAQREAAQANLRSSSARYALVMGHSPDGVREPTVPARLLPGNLDEVVSAAVAGRPTVVQAAFLEQAAAFTTRQLIGQLLPQVSLNAQLNDTEDPSRLTDWTRSASVTGHVSVPIYEAGDVRAQIRQEKETRQSLLENVQQARQQAQSDALSAWALLQSSRAQLTANQTQVEAAQVALEGVRAELQVGQRTELDVLNAQQTLNNAQVTLISTKHDIVVNSYTVLQAMGRLTADGLGLRVEQYDVEAHYNDTNGKWLDITVSREAGYAGVEAPGTGQ